MLLSFCHRLPPWSVKRFWKIPVSPLNIELKSHVDVELMQVYSSCCKESLKNCDVQSMSNFLKSGYKSKKAWQQAKRAKKSLEIPLQNTGSSKQVSPESPLQRFGKYLKTSGDALEANSRMQTASQTTHRKLCITERFIKFSNKSTTQKKNNYLSISTGCLRRKDRIRQAPSDANASRTE